MCSSSTRMGEVQSCPFMAAKHLALRQSEVNHPWQVAYAALPGTPAVLLEVFAVPVGRLNDIYGNYQE